MIAKNEVIAAAQATGANDEAVKRWMRKPLAGYGRQTPADLIEAGHGDLVLSALDAAQAGVFS